jgi:hypothetical protein
MDDPVGEALMIAFFEVMDYAAKWLSAAGKMAKASLLNGKCSFTKA